MSLEKVLIIGAGNGGQSLAVDLTSRGFKVCLYEFPEFSEKLEEKLKSRIIPSKGVVNGDIKVDMITLDEQEAAQYAKTVLVTMPALGHKNFFTRFKDQLQTGSRIYSLPGNLLTITNPEAISLIGRDILLVEFNSLPYGCRILEDGTVKISILTSDLRYSAFPSKETNKVADEISKLYPGSKKVSDILEVSLNNPNPLIHPPGVLLNIGRIEHSFGDFYMYEEGMTDSIMRVINAIDKERRDIGKCMGYELMDLEEYGGCLVDGTKKSFIECGRDAQMLGPSNRESRYITEDIPFGLVYWSEIAKKIDVATPNINSLITLASTICGNSFDNKRINLERLPNSNISLKRFLFEGK